MVQVSGGALARTSSVAPSIKIKSKFSGKNRVDTIFRAGLSALLFFLLRQACFFCSRPCALLRFFELVFKKSPTHPVHTAAEMTASTNLIQHSFELAAARCEDLTPLVYRRLFREHPEAKSMFRSEGRKHGPTASCHPSRRARARASSDNGEAVTRGCRRGVQSRSRKFDPMSAFFLIGS